jgi:hypothetical protein
MSKTTAGPTTAVSVLVTNTPVLALNQGRRSVTIVNDSANIVYLGLGVPATANNGVRLNASGGSWSETQWEGSVNAIALTGTSVVTVAEF